ncbi:serine/threonine protein kinase [Corynebacterium sp. 13CS0277]|uniref:serine/threonine-protein kinase n=1 Tax=Corynebacterium sp. 13CS0277 TaxID=2071994 RepID=UPI000D03131D|nr:serine/threonine-protein kinase [Corynebacterium sp. 13CS0277]PRQ10439.1 serine/threonine protein kinase [Corynebacterium sp. 13CS0277]
MSDNRDDMQRVIGVDRYRLLRVAGRGGMSTVWLAEDLRAGRPVALKILGKEFSDNGEFLHRFRNEALASEDIVSDHVVRTFDYQEVTDAAGHTVCYIAMEFVDGQSLADILAEHGALDEGWALDILEQAAEGLAAIHSHGLVHRDVKPGNILITPEGDVKITDFGIAKAAAAAPLTRTGMVVGTAQYVSPEQAQGLDVTPGTDVYSLAVVGYEMLAGTRPFHGDSGVSVAIAHINTPPPQITTNVSDNARELIGIALRKDPARRYADGAEFLAAVRAVRAGHRPPQPQSLPQRTARPTQMTTAVRNTPTTIATAAGTQAGRAPAVAPVAAPPSGPGVKTTAAWVAAALIVLGGVAAAIYMVTRGGEPAPTVPEETTPPPVTIVTETVSVTPTEAPTPTTTSSSAAPTSSEEPTPSDTVTREPDTVTVTVEPDPETVAPVEDEEPAPEPTQPAQPTTGAAEAAPAAPAAEPAPAENPTEEEEQ